LHKAGKLADNQLFFSNKTEKDIILREELTRMMGKNAVYIITEENTTKYQNAFINEEFLKLNIKDFSRHFYLCGPPKMVDSLTETLVKLGASPDSVVFEK
jgi:ferredoxin-NADP reductase